MGVDIESARFLMSASRQGVSYEYCLTLGRQNFQLGVSETRILLKEFGLAAEKANEILVGSYPRYAEGFFRFLGALQVDSMDASKYESATVLHDLNLPIPEALKNRFTAVVDAGTLEHVFNFPVAIRNCMEMTKVGGHFLALTPSNNYCGHGFYQFSPELFYRVLNAQNGFTVERMIAMECGPFRRWFEVKDPELIRSRVTLTNSFPLILLVQAKKVADVPKLVDVPQQSDYSATWNEHSTNSPLTFPHQVTNERSLKRRILEVMPRFARVLEAFTFTSLNSNFSFRNKSRFKRITNKT
ncbi:MAG: hypothetical protein AB1813_27315 [Verrucomicrobiota bacterium]